jgi:hypothetical protein
VRADASTMRTCYEAGLRRNPNLEGRINTRFVIDLDGHVSDARAVGAPFPDEQTARCVLDRFAALTFPPPQGGIVTVVYPIIFKPDADPTSDAGAVQPRPGASP